MTVLLALFFLALLLYCVNRTHQDATMLPAHQRGGGTFLVLGLAAVCSFMIGRKTAPAAAAVPRPAHPELKIPRILHHMWLGEAVKVPEGEYDPDSRIHPEWRASCLLHHSAAAGWTHVLWNRSTAEAFIREKQPSFLKTWLNYPTLTHRCALPSPPRRAASSHPPRLLPIPPTPPSLCSADALRYLVLYHMGGLYVDSDVECWRESSDLLRGFDVVLQGSQGHGEPATNAAMASTPGHSLWEKVFQLLEQRKHHDPDDIGFATGPQLIGDGMAALGLYTPRDEAGKEAPLKPQYHYQGSRIRVYPIGTWFHPCSFSDRRCHVDTSLQRAVGLQNLTLQAGLHHYTASWIRGLDHSLGLSSVEEARKEFCG